MHDAVNEGKVVSGQYLVLAFDFSSIDSRSSSMENIGTLLEPEIHEILSEFKTTYAKYLGEPFESKYLGVLLIQSEI